MGNPQNLVCHNPWAVPEISERRDTVSAGLALGSRELNVLCLN